MILPLALLLAGAAERSDTCRLGSGWSSRKGSAPNVSIIRSDGGHLSWNGVPVADSDLRLYFDRSADAQPVFGVMIDLTMVSFVQARRIAALPEASRCDPRWCYALPLPRRPLPPGLPEPYKKR